MRDWRGVFTRITCDCRYRRNLTWGQPRHGHPEGTLQAHIAELEANLERVRHLFSVDDGWRLRLLIHVHDIFKPDADEGVPIAHPGSHASMAARFLGEFIDDAGLRAAAQWHDEPYALWLGLRRRGEPDWQRLATLLARIPDWSLFLAFQGIDNATVGKGPAPLRWFLNWAGQQGLDRHGPGLAAARSLLLPDPVGEG